METKICKDCKEPKSLDNFYLIKTHGGDWRRPRCKSCHIAKTKNYTKAYSAAYFKRTYTSKRQLKKEQDATGYRVCKDCNISKSLDLYTVRSYYWKGEKKEYILAYCKECIKKQVREYLKVKRTTPEFKAYIKLHQAKYRTSKKGRETYKQYKKKNKEHILAARRRKDARNRESLTDGYIKASLYTIYSKSPDFKGVTLNFSDLTLEMVSIQRKKITLKRRLKNYEKEKEKDQN